MHLPRRPHFWSASYRRLVSPFRTANSPVCFLDGRAFTMLSGDSVADRTTAPNVGAHKSKRAARFGEEKGTKCSLSRSPSRSWLNHQSLPHPRGRWPIHVLGTVAPGARWDGGNLPPLCSSLIGKGRKLRRKRSHPASIMLPAQAPLFQRLSVFPPRIGTHPSTSR